MAALRLYDVWLQFHVPESCVIERGETRLQTVHSLPGHALSKAGSLFSAFIRAPRTLEACCSQQAKSKYDFVYSQLDGLGQTLGQPREAISQVLWHSIKGQSQGRACLCMLSNKIEGDQLPPSRHFPLHSP